MQKGKYYNKKEAEILGYNDTLFLEQIMRLYQPEALTLVKRSDFMVEFKEAYEIATNFFRK